MTVAHLYTLIHVRGIYGSARGEKMQREFLGSAEGVVCCTYLHKHSLLSKWTTRIRRACIPRQILVNEKAKREEIHRTN